MPSHIKLHGSKADRFEEIKDRLEDQLGYEPTNAEVVGMLMGKFGSEDE